MKNRLLLLFILAITTNLPAQLVKKLPLQQGWQFHKKGETSWYPATVPGTVHTDLLANKLIPDPYLSDHEKDLQWIEKETWEYRTSFTLEKEQLAQQHLELVFEGLDTYAYVYLNDKLILEANNMFRTWTVNIKPFLKNGENKIYIQFESIWNKIPQNTSPVLPGDEKIFVRKAQYQFGWDWGPRFVTSGLWRPVYLRCWNDLRIDNVRIMQQNLDKEKARLTAVVSMEGKSKQPCTITILDAATNQKLSTSPPAAVEEGQSMRVDIQLLNPKLWWCNGLGEPYLYHFKIQVSRGNQILDEQEMSYGIRKIRIIQEPDSIGRSFYVQLNDRKVYMKGANYIPPDNFLPRVDSARYRSLIADAKEANMNMLRVWGGGTYENDYFYDLCDENGILVWQDFMFACAMYPGDTAFMNNVKHEAEDNVTRLRNHPCIALWCGNNEIDEGWKNWGWQKQYQYSVSDSAKIWSDYLKLFHGLLSNVVSDLHPGCFYWPSSPKNGWGRKESMTEGDSHYWGVWWGNEPFETYEKKVPRFMSEFGFQAFPALSTLEKFTQPNDRVLFSPVLKAHQKHPTGFETIQTYMDREYKKPKNFESYVYISQLLQAYGIEKAIVAQRTAMPHCMGSLYWQLNDCWPVVSWSSSDYYHQWKALHYFVKKAYAPFLVAIKMKEDGKAAVYVVNDTKEAVNARLYFQLTDLTGQVKWSYDKPYMIKPNTSAAYFDIPLDMMKTYYTNDNAILSVKLKKDKEELASTLHYFDVMKNLKFERPYVGFDIKPAGNGYDIEIQVDKMAKNIWMQVNDPEAKFDDNFFDLLPMETKKVHCKSALDLEAFQSSFKITTIVDAF